MNGAATIVVVVAVLLVGFGSACVARTVAVVLSVPLAVVVAIIVSEALAPLVKAPRFQVRKLLEIEMLPCVALVERTLTTAGSRPLTATPVAKLGPALVTAIVYVTLLPATTGFGKALRLIARSAAGPTVVLTVAVLLAVTGSNSVAPTVAMAVIIPSAVGDTVMVAVADAPMSRRGTLQRTTLPTVLTVPWETVVDLIRALNGRALVTLIEVAG